jgi:hydroxyethylthiazole kinase-like uncharacterized protein yjeF
VKVVDIAQMRALEAAAEKTGLPGPALMEIAGRAFADAVVERFGPIAGQRIVVLVGPGNNGGDGLVAARWLADAGARSLVLTVARKTRDDAKLDLLRDRGVPVVEVGQAWSESQLAAALYGSALVVDALFGIGRVRPLGATIARLFEAASALAVPIVALDLPSGLDADSGRADAATPRCVATVTLGAVKRGLVIGDGPARAGTIVPVEIGVPEGAAASLAIDVLDGRLLRELLPERSAVSHKYNFGRVMVVAGSAL